MAKKKAKKKETKDKPEKGGPGAATVVMTPEPRPYPAVADEVLSTFVKSEDGRLSLDNVRNYIRSKSEWLRQSGQDCPVALSHDIENVLMRLQVSDIGEVVKEYVKLVETVRYWWVFCQERGRDAERERKLYQRTKKIEVRAAWDPDPKKDGKMTIDAVEDRVRTDIGHDNWLKVQEGWEFLATQLDQIIRSMQTDMLVQSSVWTQHELGMRNTAPAGAVGQ